MSYQIKQLIIMNVNSKKIDKLCAKVAELTDWNYHTDARIEIAKFFKLDNFVSLFEAIDRIHSREGSLNSDLGTIRLNASRELLNTIERLYGAEITKKIDKSL